MLRTLAIDQEDSCTAQGGMISRPAAADHPARFLREFVEQLDLPALGFALPVAVEGPHESR